MDKPTRGHKALRRGRCSLPNHIYLITFVTLHRRPVFRAAEPAMAAAAALHASNRECESTLLCWVLMPDHWHGLVRLAEGEDLGRWVMRLKSQLAKASNGALGQTGPVWARSFHDHAVRREADLLAVARYVVANPLRAGLVRRLGDYPYWNAVWL